MVEKNFSDILHLNVDEKEALFKQHAPAYKVYFDAELLQKHLPPTSGVRTADLTLLTTLGKALPDDAAEALAETNFVNVYGRVVEHLSTKDTMCLQYLYVWDYQAVPAHEGDYEPIFVFLKKNKRSAIYDLVHYCSRQIDLGEPNEDGPGLRVVPGWHSFLPVPLLKANDVDSDLIVQPLSDQHLEAWWNIPEEESRFKIKKFLLDPTRLEAPGHFMESPDEDARTVCCIFLEIEKALQDFDNPKDAVIEGVKRAFGKCIGIFALHRLGAFLKLLGEMNDIGMIKTTANLKEGLNIGAIMKMLSDGFVSVTSKGAEFFEGFKKSDEH
ncbi:MAG: hypothetical protein ACTSV2_03480 [Candidatus Thorarchaeota archaeon]